MSDRLVLHPDASDADWIKRAWDIPATNLPDLHEWLFWQQVPVDEFAKLTVYRANLGRLPWLRRLATGMGAPHGGPSA